MLVLWVRHRRIRDWVIMRFQLEERHRRTQELVRRAMPKPWDIQVTDMAMEALGCLEDTTITTRTRTICIVRIVTITLEVTDQAMDTIGVRIRSVWVTF